MSGSLEVRQQINPVALMLFPVKRLQVQDLLLRMGVKKKIKEASCPVSQMKGREMNHEKEKSGS